MLQLQFKFEMMSKIKMSLVFIVLTVLLFRTNSIRTTSTITYQYDQGSWSNNLVGESQTPQNKDKLSQYFLCGYSFRSLRWSVVLYNCNCGQRWYRWRRRYRCNHCPNYFETQTGGFKAIFCHYQNWNDQVVRNYDTGSPNLRGERQVMMCPPNHYAGGAVSKTGNEHGVPLGLIGLRLNCLTNTLSQSAIIESPQGSNANQQNLRQGSFIAGVKIKSLNEKLTGIQFLAEGMAVISDVSIEYKTTIDPRAANPKIIDVQKVENRGSNQVMTEVSYTNQYVSSTRYQTSSSVTKGFSFQAKVGTTFKTPNFQVQNSYTRSTYRSYTQSFTFGKDLTTRFSSDRKTTVYVRSCTELIFKNTIFEQNISIPFVAKLTFSDRYTGQFITSATVQGLFTGVVNSNVYVSVEEKLLPNCPSQNTKESNNLRN